MKIFLGIDGGGSKTEAIVAAEDGRIYGWNKSGPSNPLFMQPIKAFENVIAAANAALSPATISEQEIEHVSICVPGFQKHFSEEALAECLKMDKERISLMGDERSTMLAALGNSPGIVIAAGTGSFAIGRDEHHNEHSAGGWGPILGDEGSGYDVGRQALRAIIAEHEGKAEPTLLTQKVCNLWGIEKVEDIRLFLNSRANFQQIISALAPLVLECAQEEDAAAQNIIKQAGNSLADLAKTVLDRLDMQEDPIQVVLTGGMRNFGNRIDTCIVRRLKDKYRINATLKKPQFPTVIGAVLLAMEEAAIFPNEEVLTILKKNYDEFTGAENGTSG